MDVVNKLLDVFRSLKGNKDAKKKAGIGMAAIIGAVAAIIIAILSFRAWKTGKKMAKLLHEKAVTDEKAEQAVADAMIAESEAEKQAAQVEIEKIRKKLLEIAVTLQEAEQEYEQAKETIHEIKTWDEFDKFTKGQ
jgi:peptidoglycan hydrolase CwlO-like protein